MNLGAAARVRLTFAESSRPPPPTNAMNSRRFILSMGTFSPMHISAADGPVRSVLCTSNLPQSGWQVLGADLNCSESAWALPGRPPKDSTSAGDCCTAGFLSPQCPLWVIRVGPTRSDARGMSALPPKADKWRTLCQKRTSVDGRQRHGTRRRR